MNYTTTWTLNLSDKISNPLNNVSEKLENATKKALVEVILNRNTKCNSLTGILYKFIYI